MKVFNYPSFSFEKLLGHAYEKYYLEKQEQVTEDTVTASLNTLLIHICEANDIDHSSIKIYCLKNDDVNAFAFPNKRMVIYSGLLTECEDETELAGVMAHEIAHIEKGHIMKLLIKEIGFQILLNQLLGGNGEIIKQTGKTISSSAYDRSLEREADATAVVYLQKANITTAGIANLFSRLAKDENNVFFASWISTHPDCKERAQTIQKLSENMEINYQKVLSDEQWQKIKEKGE
jgi:predicted Zn-dependent protease